MCDHCDAVLASIGTQYDSEEWSAAVRERARLSLELVYAQHDAELDDEARAFGDAALECTLDAINELSQERLVVLVPEWMAMLGHGRFHDMLGAPSTEAYRLAEKALGQKQMFGRVTVRCRHGGPEHG